MNKSRASLASFARTAAAQGYGVVLPDLRGTGDSSGDFVDASISAWKTDLSAVIEWHQQLGGRIKHIVGLRFGVLLAAVWLRDNPDIEIDNFIAYQPIHSGKVLLNQNLRLASMSGLRQSDGQSQAKSNSPKEVLAQQGWVNCGGYQISQSLATELEILELQPIRANAFHLYEIKNRGELSTAGQKLLTAEADVAGLSGVVREQPFWMSTEIVHANLGETALQSLTAAMTR